MSKSISFAKGRDDIMTNLLKVAVLLGALFWTTGNPASAAQLLMFEEDGCYWCAKWDEEIGPIYPKTTEGKRAPLKRMNIHDEIPEFIEDKGIVHYTPTFVLIEKGQEIGRITGYPGEDNFWAMLEQLVGRLPKTTH